MLAVVAIIGTLLGIGVPSFAALVDSLRLATVSNAVLWQFALARSEAVKRKERVALCKSHDGLTCTTAGGWEQGAILFDDVDNDGRRDEAESVVQRIGALPAGWRLTGNGTVANYVSYAPAGVAKHLSGAFQAGTITLCRASRARTEARRIVLSAAGRPRVEKTIVARCE
jgi:type IV fimbrial biogenesis protein FimT